MMMTSMGRRKGMGFEQVRSRENTCGGGGQLKDVKRIYMLDYHYEVDGGEPRDRLVEVDWQVYF